MYSIEISPSQMLRKWLGISKMVIMEDCKFLEDFKGMSNLQYCKSNSKKLKECVNNSQYDENRVNKPS